MNRRDFIKTAAVAAGFVPCFDSFYPPVPELAPEFVSGMPLDVELIKAVFDPAPYESVTMISVIGRLHSGDMFEIQDTLQAHRFSGKYKVASINADSFTYNLSPIE